MPAWTGETESKTLPPVVPSDTTTSSPSAFRTFVCAPGTSSTTTRYEVCVVCSTTVKVVGEPLLTTEVGLPFWSLNSVVALPANLRLVSSGSDAVIVKLLEVDDT